MIWPLTHKTSRNWQPRLSNFPNLQQLNLSNNNIGEKGAQALAKSLPSFPNLQKLSLHINTDLGVITLRNALPKTNLQILLISLPAKSPFRRQFKKLYNRQGTSINVLFV
ncbi:MAG: hypothetical protein ACRCTK_03650 [Alphaproteobacteria bacterium]